MNILNNNNIDASNVRELIKKINIKADILFNEPMKNHTSFKIGGPADVFIVPHSIEDINKIFSFCIKQNIPYFIHGEGSNILVSDKGISGIVISTGRITEIEYDDNIITASAGANISELAEKTAQKGLSGIENFYYMPGTVGGAVWINARCYGVSISDSLLFVDTINRNFEQTRTYIDKSDYDYKKSPFQKSKNLILKAGFKLEKKDSKELLSKINEYREDRYNKGHFDFPCAGSVFKNNRLFGMPTGKIIDTLGLKGTVIGRAKVLEKHGNIIVNTGEAAAEEVIELIDLIKYKVKEKYNYEIEEEIIRVGNFS